MRRRSWRYRGPSFKSIQRKLVRMEKRNERIEHRKGEYNENEAAYYSRYIQILSFNNCFICYLFGGKAFFGRKVCDRLLRQLGYADNNKPVSVDIKMELARLTHKTIEPLENQKITEDPQIFLSYGLLPKKKATICYYNSDDYWQTLYEFMLLNVFSLTDENIASFIGPGKDELVGACFTCRELCYPLSLDNANEIDLSTFKRLQSAYYYTRLICCNISRL